MVKSEFRHLKHPLGSFLSNDLQLYLSWRFRDNRGYNQWWLDMVESEFRNVG
ncbi:MAG: hypothetical protein QOJ38_395 [Solirubrobacterales bacterium]|jgi:hypothetical protein|nr:hypothetical protein [Solirubrobacterales bacterium]